MSGLLLGVDAGGTKTDALLVRADGVVLGWARGPGANHEAIGWEATEAGLHRAVGAVLGMAGVPAPAVTASGWGLAGLDWPADEARHRTIIAGLGLGGPAVVVNDAFLALEAGADAGTGVAIVSGTGAVVVGRAADGTTSRTLGVGSGRGDWGSGGDVVRAAAEAVAQQHLGLGPATALTGLALRRSGVGSVDAYCEQVWRHGRTHLLPPDVWELAAAGDAAAGRIADRVADSLAAGAGVVARRLQLRRADVLLAGRVLDPGHPLLHARLLAALGAELPGCRPRRLGVPPVVGAVRAAGRAAGRELPVLRGMPGSPAEGAR